MTNTFLALGAYFIVAFLPKVPWYAKVLIQVVIGAVIYFGFSETMFDLPAGDSLPISSLFGGSSEWSGGGFNKYAMGVLGTVLGLIMTLVATVLYGLLGIGGSTKDSKE